MTFSVIAVSHDRTQLGAATASFSLAVGASVPAIAPGIGAALTQAWTLRAHRSHALQLLRIGTEPHLVIDQLAATDLEFAKRQVAFVDVQGRAAAWTGEQVTPEKGALFGAGFVVTGNCLASVDVLTAMKATMEEMWDAPLPQRLLHALTEGRRAGGDFRGDQSAALIVGSNTMPDVFPPDLDVDLRVDDDPTPVTQLWRMLRATPGGPHRSTDQPRFQRMQQAQWVDDLSREVAGNLPPPSTTLHPVASEPSRLLLPEGERGGSEDPVSIRPEHEQGLER